MINRGPHQITVGVCEARQMPRAVRRLGGQLSTGPIGLFDQSSAWTSAPISPSPAGNCLAEGNGTRSPTLVMPLPSYQARLQWNHGRLGPDGGSEAVATPPLYKSPPTPIVIRHVSCLLCVGSTCTPTPAEPWMAWGRGT